jgi:hypothetical protein
MVCYGTAKRADSPGERVASRRQGARILGEIAAAGINLLAYSGFPVGGGRSQLDLVVEPRSLGWRARVTAIPPDGERLC